MQRPSEGGAADQSLPAANDTWGLKRKDAPDAGAEDDAATKPRDGRARIDIYGNFIPAKAAELVTCKNCGRQVQAGVFAPHLEKCMGKGRAAARAASRRLQQMACSE